MSSAVPAEPLGDVVLAALAATGAAVLTDPAVLAGVAVDWTGRWSGPVRAAVRPGSASQVRDVLGVALRHGVPVQVQGGNTGLVGGSVPDRPSLVLLTTALDRLGPVDPLERTVVAGAGVTLARLAAHAASAGLVFGVDLAARDSATVGGLAATNAGGLGVCAYGMMRDQVRGLRAVLADGRVVDTLGRPRKDNTGYDLTGLLVGSEGTLGVITDVEVVLHPKPPASTVALLAVDDLTAAVQAARSVAGREWQLLAAEVVDASGAERAARALGEPVPLVAGWLLLLEVADGGTAEGLGPVGEHVVAVATEEPARRRLWALRERQTELFAALAGGGPEKLDVSLRLDRLDAGVAALRAVVAERGGTLGIFGHALDGNLHLQLIGAPAGTVAAVLEAVAALGGSISAEHGIGRAKTAALPLSRSPQEIGLMASVRTCFDPAGLLNPGVLLG